VLYALTSEHSDAIFDVGLFGYFYEIMLEHIKKSLPVLETLKKASVLQLLRITSLSLAQVIHSIWCIIVGSIALNK
jgi:hypothetical protein